jgi:type II secretory pathway predicted ATPase ExeA
MTDSGFTSFWGVRHSPFLGRVDVPAQLLLEGQRAAATRVLIAAQEGAPMVVASGPEGSGATVLARWLYDSLPESTHHAILLTSSTPGVEPAALTTRVAAFGTSRLGIQPVEPGGGSLREQLIALAPVFDALRSSGKRLAVIVDNAAYLAGEPWAAYMLAVIRQGELVDGVVQFFLLGQADAMDALCAAWPRALDSRAIKVRMRAPDEVDQRRWIENRLVMAGCDPEAARKVFTDAAVQRAIALSRDNLTRLGRIAEGAMIEAFMAGARQVAVHHVDAVSSATGRTRGNEPASESSSGSSLGSSSGPAPVNAPGLLDLLKPE